MDKSGKILVIGGGIGGMEASLNLADSGFKVYLADEKPNIGGKMSQLDKTFPTNDCSMCIMAPKLVEVGRNPNIELLMNTEVVRLEGTVGNFTVTIKRQPRRVIPEKCTSCALCASGCPLEVANPYNKGLSKRSAAFLSFLQAIPSTYMIDKEIAPCVIRCPVEINVRDYVGLIAEGRYLEALDVIREKLPFPGIIGRICPHPCEEACLRGRKVDQPIAICALKRFVADYEMDKREIPVPETATVKDKKVAIIGGGPAGLACAIEIKKAGYEVTIYEAHDRLGGMLYLGIPAYRLPKEVLARETSVVEKMGIDVKYSTTVGRDIPVTDILNKHDATFICPGAQKGRALGIENENAKGVLAGVDFLRAVNRGEPISIGNNVFVVGGGNVAIDVALTAKRMGAKNVHMVCLERQHEMPAHKWEINQAVEEGIKIHNTWGTKRIITEEGAVSGMECKRCIEVFDSEGRFHPCYDESITHVFKADTIIIAIGQAMDTDFLKYKGGTELFEDGRIKVDPVTLETSIKGVFAGGDAVTGPKTAIDAIHQGQVAAESILRFFEGKDLRAGRLAKEDNLVEDIPQFIEKKARVAIPETPVDERMGFGEVYRCISETEAIEEAKRCLSCRKCLGCTICTEFCEPEAIDFFEEPSEETIQVGSIIIASGFDEYDPNAKKELGYGIYKNVVTSTEFERILSVTGPTGNIIMRPSDGKIPQKIAFIQCVGSRDKTNEYCSSVCCMYATKEAVIAKEHQNDIESTIFYMDIRAYGKGFDEYYERAKNIYGVRYVKSMISRVLEDLQTNDIKITYIDEHGGLASEVFDLVVLSIGLKPSKKLSRLAEIMGFELNRYGFVKTDMKTPLSTSREGIFVCGASESPKDIQETVVQASGAACEAGSVIASVRGKDIVVKQLPAEKNVDTDEPRIGVFVCNCGINIGSIVDVPAVKRYAETLPNVVLSDENLFTCSQDTQDKMKKMIDEYNINRVVVASCSPRTHEPLFRETIREAGLNKYLFDMANIRDQCSWVHMHEKKDATEKAKALVRMAVMNSNFIKPLGEVTVDVNKKALVVGGGITGMTVALKLANQNFEVFLIEKNSVLGGNLRHIYQTLDGTDIQGLLAEYTEKVTSHPLIHVLTDAKIKEHAGFKGNYKTVIIAVDGKKEVAIEHGVIVIATGGSELKPHGKYLYGEDKRVLTQSELEACIMENQLPTFERCVMIQCVGSRDEKRPYCSRVCCSTSIKNAIALKNRHPDEDVVILYRDIRTYGFLERYYLQARRLGVRFIRYSADNPPVIEQLDNALSITCFDPSLMEQVTLSADIVALSSAIIPAETQELATILKLPRTNHGFFLEAHMKLRPVDFASDGIFLCGLAHSPKNIQECIAQAEAAAARAITILSKEKMAVGGVVAHVEGEKCAACLTCVRACPYAAPFINENGEAEIDISKCKGCGSCVAECPAKAIDLMHYRDAQITEKIKALCASGG
ncbi:MAG: Glutamate synthase (NADPH) small chain [Deltaproteobacteria bacterium ADurb.Bin026]|nr:MAG: Glutamate synthase (NADPH) small chain [Deltaproteobacteria bacterium ADurb.Bin026]